MRSPLSDRFQSAVLALALMAGLAVGLPAQELRDVLSKEVAVGQDEAVLRLGVTDGGSLSIALRAGEVWVGDEAVGTYEPGGTLDTAWRTLLGTAVALENGPLASALVAWTPPEGLDDTGRSAAVAIDQALEQTLEGGPPAPAAAPDAPTGGAGALAALLGRTERLQGLAQALAGVDTRSLQLTVGEDLVIGAGEDVDATVVVVDGDLAVEGVLRGDAIVLGGDVLLRDGGRVIGDIRLTDGRVLRQGGSLEGETIEIEAEAVLTEREIRERIREEVRQATRDGVDAAPRAPRGSRGWGPLERVGRGIGGAIGNLFTALVLGLVGGVALYFAGPRLDVVADTVRRSPGRAAMVGAAGAFLVLPAWVLGMIALAISIIGIPALLLWVPLFPLAVIAAAAVGYLAVARNLGTWVARQRYPFMDWVSVTNPYSLIFGGVIVLMSAFVAANLLSIVPFLGALHGLLVAVGVIATTFAVLAGFGAVILTRGGRPNDLWADDFFSSPTSAGAWTDEDAEPVDPSSAPDTAPDVADDSPDVAEDQGPDAPERGTGGPAGEPWSPTDG